MAVDEALSLCVTQGPPVLRFYCFRPPALSVGRFQPTGEAFRFDDIARDRIGFVRRPTGGQAVLHDNELTYAVILAKSHLTVFRKRQVYRFISRCLLQGLRNLGITASFSSTRIGGPRNPDCFATTGEYEIVGVEGRKIVGSAQYSTRAFCLQHGSIRISPPAKEVTNYLTIISNRDGRRCSNLEEELQRPVTYDEAVDSFYRGFAAAVELAPSALNAEETELADKLKECKYSRDAWNRKL